MIKVCDAIMGTGKSSAAIDYMNKHKYEKFIYITPYLEEAERIKRNCPDMMFVEPSNKIGKYHFKKCEHTAALIKKGRNITTTHQAFKMYTDEMLDDIKKYGYRLIIDENVDVLERFDFHADDMKAAVEAGIIKQEGDAFTLTNSGYKGRLFKELCQFLKTHKVVQMEDISGVSLFYWVLPPELITSFQDVIILTYMFNGQSLHHFLEMYNLPYSYIGIEKVGTKRFRFSDTTFYTPSYVGNLKNMIHILDSDKMNEIGEDYYSLSMSWYDKNPDQLPQLKNHVNNCFKNKWKGAPANDRMWSTYSDCRQMITGKGYTKSFLNFNMKATNSFRDKHYMTYLVNIFMNVGEKTFYHKHGIEASNDDYALSIMVQWIWRSAIRDGDSIYIYIPSKRMRELLIDWIDRTSEGGNAIEK